MIKPDYLPLMIDAAEAMGIEAADFVIPTDHYVAVNGIRMHYLDWGNPHLPHLVLLHGGRLEAHTWDMPALLLRDHYHLIAPDLRGHGDTDRSPEELLGQDTFELMLEDTRQFIECLDVGQVILVGMSMGGLVAMQYAARYPEKLRALGIVDVSPEGNHTSGNAEIPRKAEFHDSFEACLERTVERMPHRPVAQLRYRLMHGLRQTPEGRWTWKYDTRPGTMLRSPDIIEKNAGKGLFHDLWDDVRRIEAPTLLFYGAQSRFLTREIAQRTAAAMRNARIVKIDPATHNVHSDNPVDFARALHDFLQESAV